METITTPKLKITFSVDLEIDYDPFEGRTPEMVAEAIQDEIHDLLFEASPQVTGVYSTITNILSDD